MRSIDEVIKETAIENVQVNTNNYQIERKEMSDSACIFFASHTTSNQKVVIKVLKDFSDNRYKLDTTESRQQCQLEALRINQKFTDNVYQGMGPIYTDSGKFIWDCDERDIVHINTIYQDMAYIEKHLDPDTEYALVMEKLPESNRLDVLLAASLQKHSVKPLLVALVNRIVCLHQDDISRPLSPDERDDNEYVWGSAAQICSKLKHNFGLYDKIALVNDSLHHEYEWLKRILYDIATNELFEFYLEERLRERKIKHCHGDLKTNNIWLESDKTGRNPKHPVKISILDAVDFNANYSNIDVLSDIAMLAVDIEAYSGQQWMATYLLKRYLKQTGQAHKQAAKVLLTYYMAEKAIVRAAVSLCYDNIYGNVPLNIERRFLKIAARNTTFLKRQFDGQKLGSFFLHSPISVSYTQ